MTRVRKNEDPLDRKLFLLSFWCIAVLTVVDRGVMLHLTAPFVSHDLTIIWHAATDYAHCIFYEPFFYGQDYGVMLEALLAAPFVRLGMDIAVVLPYVMSFLAVAPFWSFAWYHYRQDDRSAALVFLAIPLLLPSEHGLQQTGWNGLATLAFAPWTLLVKKAILRDLLFAFVLSLAVLVNPNALVFVFALGIWYVIRAGRPLRVLVHALVGFVPVVAAWWAARHFYDTLSVGVVNTIFDWRMVFHPELVPEAFAQLDLHFAWLCPLWWPNGSMVLALCLAAVAILLLQHRYAAALGMLGGLLLVVVSFSFAKVHDGTTSIFFPYSRMYLALPLLLAWGMGWAVTGYMPGRIVLGISVAICVGFFAVRTATAHQVFEDALADRSVSPVRMIRIDGFREVCRLVAGTADLVSADVVVLEHGSDDHLEKFISYGGPALEPTLPPTYLFEHERRYWRRETEGHAEHGTVLFVGGKEEYWQRIMRADPAVVQLRAKDPPIYVRHGSCGPLISCLEHLHEIGNRP